MISVHIAGASREVGRSQGYVPLWIRDGSTIDATNGQVVPTMTTAWEPTPEELARLNAGGKVEIEIFGILWPPIVVRAGEPP